MEAIGNLMFSIYDKDNFDYLPLYLMKKYL